MTLPDKIKDKSYELSQVVEKMIDEKNWHILAKYVLSLEIKARIETLDSVLEEDCDDDLDICECCVKQRKEYFEHQIKELA